MNAAKRNYDSDSLINASVLFSEGSSGIDQACVTGQVLGPE